MKTSIALAAFAAIGLSASTVLASEPGGRSRDPEVGSQATKALNLLEAHGYGAFRNFQADGHDFTANVDKHNRMVTLLIDPTAGTVQAKN